jgi:hypothetical protein
MPDEEVFVDLRTDRPTPARMYDYYLGGKDNFTVDRDAAERVLAAAPEVRRLARENRAFLRRAVRFLAGEAGVRQFLDIGAGLPTQGNVHEVAQEVNPGARVVYVDNDPIVRAHAAALLPSDGSTAIIEADMREPETILRHPHLHRVIDLDEPVAVLFVAVLPFLTDEEDPYGIVGTFRDAVRPGSYLTISHGIMPDRSAEGAKAAADVYNTTATSPAVFRSREEILRFFDGHDLVEPGLVHLPGWRPEGEVEDPEEVWILGGVGRRR